MKKHASCSGIFCLRIVLVSIAIIFWMTPGIVDANDTNKKRIVIFDFDAVGVQSDLAKSITEMFRVALINTKIFRVVERETLDKVLKEQKFQQTGLIDEKNAVKIGKILGAENVVLGSVGKLENSYTINCRLVDVETAESLMGKSTKYNTEDEISEKIQILAEEFAGIKTSKTTKTPVTYEPPTKKSLRQPNKANLWWGIALVAGGIYAAIDGFKDVFKADIDANSWNYYYQVNYSYVYSSNYADCWANGTIKNIGNVNVRITKIKVTYESNGYPFTYDIKYPYNTISPGASSNWSLDSTLYDSFLYTPTYARLGVEFDYSKEYIAKSETEGYLGVAASLIGWYLIREYFVETRTMAKLTDNGLDINLVNRKGNLYLMASWKIPGIGEKGG